MDWQPIETAPKDGTAFQAKIPGHGQDNVIAWTDGLLDSNGNDCGGWSFVEDQEAPDCWTGGVCWEVNEDGNESVEPTVWKPLQERPVMFSMFKDKESLEWRGKASPELTQALAELFTMAFRVHNETDFCVRITWSGSLPSLSIGIYASKALRAPKVWGREIEGNTGYTPPGYEPVTPLTVRSLKAVRDELEEILETGKIIIKAVGE